jgi:hypothetical protein
MYYGCACWLAAAHYLTLWDKRHFGASAPLSKKYKYTSGTHKSYGENKKGSRASSVYLDGTHEMQNGFSPFFVLRKHIFLWPRISGLFLYVFTFFALQQHSLIMTPFLMTKRHTLSKGKGSTMRDSFINGESCKLKNEFWRTHMKAKQGGELMISGAR